MYLNVTYDQEFDDLMMHLRAKYSNQLFDIDGIGEQLDISSHSKQYFINKTTTADVSIDANANVSDKSVASYHTEILKPLFKLNSYYMLWKNLKKLYNHKIANEIVEKQLIGNFYINDFWGYSGYYYCYNYSTYDIAIKGLPMVDKIISMPPKYLYSFMNQVLQFSIIASNSSVGACGLADLLVVASYYIGNIIENKKDAHFEFKDEAACWEYVKETITSFIYSISQPARGIQAIFSNVSIYDNYFLDDMINDYTFEDGKTINKNIVKKVQEIYMQIFNEESERTTIVFPVTTACFSINKQSEIQDEEFLKQIAKYNKKFGFMNIFCGNTSIISSCCRLNSDKNNEYFNVLGSGGTKIGSATVVTLNLPRLAYKYKNNIEMLKTELKNEVNNIARINNVRKYIIKKRIDNGNYPLYTHGFVSLDTQFSTCGITGFNECLDILGYDILTKDGQKFGLELLDVINKENDKCAKQYKTPHNVELTPSENSAITLVKKDKLFGYYNGKYELMSNQFIPLTTNADMLDRIKLSGMFDSQFGGGSICHINVETQITDNKQIEDLIKICAKKGVKTFAINYNLQKCENGHMTVGKNNICPICGKPIIDNYTRVVGYLSSIKNWNKVRRDIDYPNRQFY